jgi:predicted dehydrogenase
MKALIVGLGSIGRRHLSNLRRLAPRAHITVWRQHTPPNTGEIPPKDADQVVFSLEDALAARPEIAIIANPAPFHVSSALHFAREGISLLIEKPLSCSLDGIHELMYLCTTRSQTLMIGYNLRFEPSLQVLKAVVEAGKIGQILSMLVEVGYYLPDWRPDTDYAKGVSAQKRLGGGAVMELSHELDYARWLLGEVRSVSAESDRLGDLYMDVENVADIHLRFACGTVGSMHLDMLQRAPARSCKLIGSSGTLLWDGISRSVRMYLAADGRWQDLPVPAYPDRNEIYVQEMRHFLQCVDTGQAPLITGEDGLQVLKIALAIRASAQLHKAMDL